MEESSKAGVDLWVERTAHDNVGEIDGFDQSFAEVLKSESDDDVICLHSRVGSSSRQNLKIVMIDPKGDFSL